MKNLEKIQEQVIRDYVGIKNGYISQEAQQGAKKMTQEEILTKIYFYTEEQIYECNIGIRIGPSSDFSPVRHKEGAMWKIYESAQKYKDLDILKSKLNLWKTEAVEQRENLSHIAFNKFHGNVFAYKNADGELEGKIFACDDLLEYISKLEKE